MHPSTYSSITRLACVVSLGLIVTPAIGLVSLVVSPTPETTPRAAARSEDDRGSGRLSRGSGTPGWVSFRGSGRIDPKPPTPTAQQAQVAYRGSGRITNPHSAA